MNKEVIEFFKGRGSGTIKSIPAVIVQEEKTHSENYLLSVLSSNSQSIKLEFPKGFKPKNLNGLFMTNNKLDNTGILFYKD